MQDQLDALNDGASNISLREYGDILRRRRTTILQTFMLVLIAGVIVTFVLPPTYRASARMLVEAPSFGLNTIDTSNPLSELYRPNQMYNVQTQVELLNRSELRKAVAKELDGPLPTLFIQQIPQTQIIEVAAEGDNAELVAKAPNVLLENYVNTTGDATKDKLNNAIIKVNEGLRVEQRRLQDAEKRLEAFKRMTNVVELGKNSEIEQQKATELASVYEDLAAQIRANKAEIAAVQREIAQVGATTLAVPSQLSDPEIQRLETEIAGLEAQRDAIQVRVTPDNPKFKEADAQIARLKMRLAEVTGNFAERNKRTNPVYADLLQKLATLRVTSAGLEARSSELSRSVAETRQRLSNYPAWQRRLDELQREYDNAKRQYAYYEQQSSILDLRQKTRPINAMISERAEVPTVPIRPQKAQNIIFSGLLGLFLGLCLALLQEFLDDRVNSPDEADRILRLPNLGHIPVIEEEGLRLIRDIDTFSPILESYRSLRTNINFAAVGNPMRSLVVTSSGPGEGKSTTTANLAMAMALNGKRVIVVDGDLRRPSQHKLFNIPVTPGLTDILVGTHTIGEVMRPTNVDRISIIPAGSVPPNPAELIGSAAMSHFIAALRATADIILIDSPPVLAVADAILLSSRVDGVLLVLGFGETRKSQARQAREMLARARANVLGTVLNKIDNQSSSYYYGKYYLPNNDGGMSTSQNGIGSKKNGVGGYVNGSDSEVTAPAALPADTRAVENDNKN